MRSFKTLFKLGALLPLMSISSLSADVLIWASDNRSGQPVRAEQAEWLRYLQSQSQASNPLVTPTQAGVAQDYPMHLAAQADVGALMTSRLATGSDAALWVQLNANGLEWVLEQNGEAQQLRTPATSDGLALGLNWMGMQLSMATPASADQSTQPLLPAATGPLSAPSTTQPQTGVAVPATTPAVPAALAYQHKGTQINVSGVFDAPDFLRLTQGLRALEGVDRVYPASINGTDVQLVLGSDSLSASQLQSLLAQQPWLRQTEQGGLRWDALALPLPGGQTAQGLVAPMAENSAEAPAGSAPAIATPAE